MLCVAGHCHYFRFRDAERESVRDESVATAVHGARRNACVLSMLREALIESDLSHWYPVLSRSSQRRATS